MSKTLRNILAFIGLAKSQAKLDWQKWDAEQKHKLESGEEIEPPWIFAPNTEPWSGEWKQGGGEYWLLEIWLPFWQKLGERQRGIYLEKWQPPTKEWYEYLTIHWNKKR